MLGLVHRYTPDSSSPFGIRVSEERLPSTTGGVLNSTELLEDAGAAVRAFLLPAGCVLTCGTIAMTTVMILSHLRHHR
eukprot:3013161-Pyramimonas_sp.AAC.1